MIGWVAQGISLLWKNQSPRPRSLNSQLPSPSPQSRDPARAKQDSGEEQRTTTEKQTRKSLGPADAGFSAIEAYPGWSLSLSDVILLSSRQGRGGARPELCGVYRLHPQSSSASGPCLPSSLLSEASWPGCWKHGTAAELQKTGPGSGWAYVDLGSTSSTFFPNHT